uniref:Uncharacterized protein n=1 Tax=Rhizophora mucronata TaxID=61149 RepID=A0A2P2PVB4_RHIMU
MIKPQRQRSMIQFSDGTLNNPLAPPFDFSVF